MRKPILGGIRIKICFIEVILWFLYVLFFALRPGVIEPNNALVLFLLMGAAFLLANLVRVWIEHHCARSEDSSIVSWQPLLFLLNAIIFQAAFLGLAHFCPARASTILSVTFLAASVQTMLPWVVALLSMPPAE